MEYSRFAPAAQQIFEMSVPDIDKDPDGYFAFWKEQIRRCISGYQVKGEWIPGVYYFHLNFAKILRYSAIRNDKSFYTPLYRDLDHEYFLAVHEAELQHRGIIILKARRKGFSVNNASLLLHSWLFHPGRETAIGAFDDPTVMDIRNKILDVRERVPPELSQKAEPDNIDLMEATHKVQTQEGWKKEGNTSRLYFRNFGGRNGHGAMRGLSLKYLLFEESGKNPVLKKSFLASEECFKEGELLYGVPIIGGTADAISLDSPDYEHMWYEHDEYQLNQFFVSAAKVYYPFYDSNGISDMKGAEEAIKKEHASRKRMEDKEAYYTILQEKPLEPAHCFMGGDNDAKLPIEIISEQIANIKTSTHLQAQVRRGSLEWVGGKFNHKNPAVKWIPDDVNGKVQIAYPPMTGRFKNLDVAGVDTYFYNSAPQSPSMGAMVVYRRFCAHDSSFVQEAPVALLSARYKTTEEFYDNCLKLAVYYDSPMLVEYDEQFGKYMERHNAFRFMKERPIAADSPFSKASNRFMVHMKVHQKNMVTNLLRDSINKHSQNILFINLLEDMKQYGVKNTDMCFLPGHKVQCERGFINIEDVSVGDMVLTHNNRYRRVSDTLANQCDDDVYKIKISGSPDYITCTEKHPFWSAKRQGPSGEIIAGSNWKHKKDLPNKSWVEARNLSKGDYLFIPKRKDLPKSKLSDFELYLLGWYLSDGYMSKAGQIKITFQMDQLHIAKHIREKLIEYDFADVIDYGDDFIPVDDKCRFTRKRPSIKKPAQYNCHILTFTSPRFRKVIERNVSDNKILAPDAYNSSGLMPLLVGYLEGDGSQQHSVKGGSYRCSLSVVGANHDMIRQIRQIMLDEGIWCTTFKHKKKHGGVHYVVDTQDWPGINRIAGYSLKFDKVRSDRSQKLHHIADDNGYWVLIKSIDKESYSGKVYNLEVEEDHSYTVDFVATHNCMAFGLALMHDLDNANIEAAPMTKEERDVSGINLFYQKDQYGNIYLPTERAASDSGIITIRDITQSF